MGIFKNFRKYRTPKNGKIEYTNDSFRKLYHEPPKRLKEKIFDKALKYFPMISIEGLGKIDALIFELLVFFKKVPILNQVSIDLQTQKVI